MSGIPSLSKETNAFGGMPEPIDNQSKAIKNLWKGISAFSQDILRHSGKVLISEKSKMPKCFSDWENQVQKFDGVEHSEENALLLTKCKQELEITKLILEERIYERIYECRKRQSKQLSSSSSSSSLSSTSISHLNSSSSSSSSSSTMFS